MDIGSSNFFSVSASTNKGMSGMISGMDTENMVKQMLLGTQGKIDKQQAMQSQAEWKQEMYRDIIGAINGFQDKYFDTSFDSGLSSNFAKADFFNTMISKISGGSAVKVISSSPSASVGDMDIIVEQLAANAKLESEQRMSGTVLQIEGEKFDTSKENNKLARFNKEIVLKVDDAEVTVDLNGADTTDKIAERFNAALKDKGVTASVYDNRLRLTAATGTKVALATEVKDGVTVHKSSALGLTVSGLTTLGDTALTDADGKPTNQHVVQGGQLQPKTGITFDMTLDGITKKITLSDVAIGADKKATTDSIIASLNTEVHKAFGDYVKVVPQKDNSTPANTIGVSFQVNVNGELGHQLSISGADASLIGITPGSSTNIGSMTKLGELGKKSGQALQGDLYQFSINGNDFTFKSSDTLGSMLNTINGSNAGVRINYSALSDTFSMEATSSGSKYGIEVKQTQGNLLSVLFGKNSVSAADSVMSKELTVGSIAAGDDWTKDTEKYSTKSATLRMNVDGKSYTFALPAKKDIFGNAMPQNKSEIETALNTWLEKTFETHDKLDKDGKPILDKDGKAEQEANLSFANGRLNISGGKIVKFEQSTVDPLDAKAVAEAKESDLAYAMGFNITAKSNVADKNTLVKDIVGIGDKASEFTYSEADPAKQTLGTLTGHNAVGGITYADGRLKLEGSGVVDLSGTSYLKDLFGQDSVSFGLSSEKLVKADATDTAAVTEDTKLSEISGITAAKFNVAGAAATGDTLLKDVTGVTIDGTSHEVRFDKSTGRLVLADKNFDYAKDAEMTKLFGEYISDADKKKMGADAKLVINGTATTRSGNTFTVDGITLQATQISTSKTDANGKPIFDKTTVATERDVDTVVKGFKSMVEDYNKMLNTINDYVDADRTYRKYDPLTSEQKKDMSEKEIELWEKKSKEGLLHRESDVDTFLSEMRNVLYTKPIAGKLALYDIGIETGSYKEKGKLTIDETKLRNALSTDPGSVMTLFTASDGLAPQMMKAMKSAANLSAANPGRLVQTAGMKGWASESNNTLTNNIKSIKDRITDLQYKYEQQRQRYWNQFNSMEKTLSSFNTQSSYLMQQFGG